MLGCRMCRERPSVAAFFIFCKIQTRVEFWLNLEVLERSPRGPGSIQTEGIVGDPEEGAGPPVKLYKIGEVIKYSGISRQTIHNYTMLGLITEEERTPSGHRLYGEAVFERLKRITELKKSLSLKEIRKQLE